MVPRYLHQVIFDLYLVGLDERMAAKVVEFNTSRGVKGDISLEYLREINELKIIEDKFRLLRAKYVRSAFNEFHGSELEVRKGEISEFGSQVLTQKKLVKGI